jgi:ADP-ribose pyrophosphatase
MPNHHPKLVPETENKRTVFKTEWFDVEEISYGHIESFRGKPYYRINSADGIIVLAMTEKDEIILVRQFRPALGQYTLEFPAGDIDQGETPEQAAIRELHEETGYVCRELSYLGAGRLMSNRLNSLLHAFFGKAAVKDPQFIPCAESEPVLVSHTDFKALVLTGAFEQYAALALLVLAEWKLDGQLVRHS